MNRYILLPEGAEIVGYVGTVRASNAIEALKLLHSGEGTMHGVPANLSPSMMLWQVALEGEEYRLAADIVKDAALRGKE